jgi:hypothetical protein
LLLAAGFSAVSFWQIYLLVFSAAGFSWNFLICFAADLSAGFCQLIAVFFCCCCRF